MQLEEGHIIYTTTVSSRPTKETLKMTLKKPVIAMVLGMYHGGEVPGPDTIMSLIGNAGFIGCDDIIECLGQESFDKLTGFFNKKYRGE